MSAQIASMIAKAISQGFTAKTILKFISSKFPQYSNAINNAAIAGFAADKILKHLVNGKDKNIDDDSYLTQSEKIDKNSDERQSRIYKKTGMAALAVAGIGAGLTATALRSAALRNTAIQASQILPALQGQGQLPPPNQPLQIGAIPPQSSPNNPPIQPPQPTPPPAPLTPNPNMGQQMAQQAQAPVIQAMQPSSSNQIAGASQALQQPQQPIQQQAPAPIFEQLLQGVDVEKLTPPQKEQLKFLSMISDQLQSKGKTLNDPEFKNLAKKIKNVVVGKPGMILEENARFNAGQEQKQANVKPLDIEQNQEPISVIDSPKIETLQSIKKGESVVTEDGNIAEIKGTSGNNFLIEENGKIRQVPMDSLRAEPEAIKKSKIVFDPSKVPESERSAALAISLPMPDRSAIINMFHDGSFYLYRRKDGKPIDESIIRRIIDGQDLPISTGETFMGAWNQENGDSRGSASFKELTALAQDATKPNDPTKPLIFEKITDNFVHGYLKQAQSILKEAGKNFSAKPKKTKK